MDGVGAVWGLTEQYRDSVEDSVRIVWGHCNPLACGCSMGKRKTAVWLEVSNLAGNGNETQKLDALSLILFLYRVVCLGQPPKPSGQLLILRLLCKVSSSLV